MGLTKNASTGSRLVEAKAIIVDKIYTTNRDRTTLVGKTILTSQRNPRENGYYIQKIKQSDPSQNTIFVDTVNDAIAFYDHGNGTFSEIHLRRFILDTNFTTTSTTAVDLQVPVIRGRITSLEITGCAHDSSHNHFKKKIEGSFSNGSGTHYSLDGHPTLTVGGTSFPNSNVSLINSGSAIILRISGEASTKMHWHIKGDVHL